MKHEFSAQVGELLNLMIHSLYSNKEIFLRELISNASDAIDKLNYLSLSDEKYKSICENWRPRIDIKCDKEAKTLTISDNGIGMDEAELIANLGTIANSGTKGFLAKLSGDAKKDSALIGQFGVGFYSAFMVASKIEVKSRKAGEDKAFLWSSDAKSYDISECQKDGFGTDVILHLNEGEFAESFRIQNIIKKYSNHIAYPIFADIDEWVAGDPNASDEKLKDGHYESKNTQINKASAIWQMNRSQLKESDYNEFYAGLSHDSSAPLATIHTKAEGTLEFATLFFIPSTEPFDLFRADYQSGVKLYVKRVFITDDAKELLPSYLRFVKGVMDVEDLPLNVSREILQENRILANVKEQSIKKIFAELEKMMKNDRAKYEKFWQLFGKVLKEGLYGFNSHKEQILKLCLFKSSQKEGLISLSEYKEAMAGGQKDIYFISGSSEGLLRTSPLLESYKKRDINVLICDGEIDNIVMPMAGEFEGCAIANIANQKAELSEDEKKEQENATKDAGAIISSFKESLKDEVKDVKISSRLTDSAVCLVFDENDPDYATQMLMRQMGHEPKDVKPILELNWNHEIFTKLKDNAILAPSMAKVLFGMAKIAEGASIENPSEFNKALEKILSKAL